MLRSMLFSAALLVAGPALAGGPALDAQVLLVVPNHSGSVPAELRSMQKALASKGYDGAAITSRSSVHLERGVPKHVRLGTEELDFTLLSVTDGTAKVSVQHAGHRDRVTTVSTKNTRFLITKPKK